jgi:hypothetical protein
MEDFKNKYLKYKYKYIVLSRGGAFGPHHLTRDDVPPDPQVNQVIW